MCQTTDVDMLTQMETLRVCRKLIRRNDGTGWQIDWITTPYTLRPESAVITVQVKEHAMKKQISRWGCAIAGLLILTLLALGGGWWYLRLQNVPIDTTPTSPVLVFIVSPPAGDEINAGDFITVDVQAVAPEPMQSAELFVDGQSLGMITESPQNVSWNWQAWPLGIHSFYAKSTTANGQIGYSQVVVVNVRAGDQTMQVFAEEGQTLEQIGAGFGVPPGQVAGANPKINPSQPLPGGKPVKIPVGDGGAGNGAGQGQSSEYAGGFNPLFISWKFTPTGPVDKSYCYTSTGNGVWDKVPKDPFNFIAGGINTYTQFFDVIPSQQLTLQMQCWGWLGGVLKYLGQGETKFDVQQLPQEVKISGENFVLVGAPEISPDAGGGGGVVKPPFALRETKDAAECTTHGHPLLASFICDTLLNAPVKEYIVLVWEWQPEVCWPGFCKYEINEIDGYMIYQLDSITQASSYFLKEIKNPGQKVTAVPLPWGAKCYGVTAIAGGQESEMAIYCPGVVPETKKAVLTPTDWLTANGLDFESGDCDNYGQADSYLLQNQKDGFGNQPGQILVGAIVVDTECFKDILYSGAIKFDPAKSLPPNAVVQSAVLTFSKIFMDYGATGWAGGKPTSCVASIGKAKQSWTQLVGPNHFADNTNLYTYNSPLTSLNSFMALKADVTSAVSSWVKHPENNHGFILNPSSAPLPGPGNGTGECTSGLGNFQLEINYFAP
ncbi:MAG: Ig-like domain-containing protein [Anaerolineales bacterium]|nr:Ig-like domain-containing protein [Anaerolineales bacterium]